MIQFAHQCLNVMAHSHRNEQPGRLQSAPLSVSATFGWNSAPTRVSTTFKSKGALTKCFDNVRIEMQVGFCGASFGTVDDLEL